MKKLLLMLLLACSTTMSFALSPKDSIDVKHVFAKVGPQGVTYDFNAGEARIAQLTQDIENYKVQMNKSAEDCKNLMSQSAENYKTKIAQSQESNKAVMDKEQDGFKNKIAQLTQEIETVKNQMKQSADNAKAKLAQEQDAHKTKMTQEQEGYKTKMAQEQDGYKAKIDAARQQIESLRNEMKAAKEAIVKSGKVMLPK